MDRFNVHEALAYLEDACENETDGDVIVSASIFFEPPENTGGESDEDSGDEEVGSPDNLTGQQLRAPATLELQKVNSERSVIGDGSSCGTNTRQPSKKARVEEGNAIRLRFEECEWQSHTDKTFNGETEWRTANSSIQSSDESPTTLFEKFFTNDVYQLICEETIRYAASKGRHNFSLTVDEVKGYIAILLLSGYVPLPRRSMFWESKEDCHNTVAADIMPRNRFDSIMQNLHLADNANLDTSDKFAKVRRYIELINTSCLDNFIPEQTISVDESMIPYFGRHGAKQYIRGKPIKFGYKMWMAATPLGYCVQFDPYLGAGSNMDPSLGVGGSVVSKLASSLPDQESSYHVVMDNFFTSLKLLKHLQTQNVFATGTIRSNRLEKAPLKDVKELEKESRGSYDSTTDAKSGISVVRWKDNKVVTLASSFCGVLPLGKAKRYSRSERKKIDICQPKVVAVYNKGMGGVDRCDQNLSAYMINIRSKKWWWPIFRFGVDLAVNNAFQLYRIQKQSERHGTASLDFLGFRRYIVETYYRRYRSMSRKAIFPAPRASIDTRVNSDARFDAVNHWIAKGKQRRCHACKGTSVYYCEKCGVALHPECFKNFHTEQN